MTLQPALAERDHGCTLKCHKTLLVVSVDLSLKAFVKIPVQKGSASLFLSRGCRSFTDEKCSSLELHKYFKLCLFRKFFSLLALLAGLQGTYPGLS